MIKVSLAQVKLLAGAVGKMLKADTSDWKTMFRLEDFKKEIEKHLATAQKVEHKLFEKHGEKKDDQLVVPKEKEQVFYNELGELMSEEVEFDIKPIDPTYLKNFEINTFDFEVIKPFLSEEFIAKRRAELDAEDNKKEEKNDGH